MPVTVNDVVTQARKHLLDTAEVTGTLYSDSQYLPFLHTALDELTKTVRLLGNWKLIRDRAALLQANTGFLDLNYNFPGLGVLESVWCQAPVFGPAAITTIAVGGTGLYTITIPSTTGLTVGSPIAIYGTSNATLDTMSTVSAVLGATQFQCAAVAGLSATGGYVASVTSWGFPIAQIMTLPTPAPAAQPSLWYLLENGGIYLASATADRLLRLRYELGGWQTPALTDQVDLLDGFNVLSQLLALAAGKSLQMDPERLAGLHNDVYGDARSGKLGSMTLLSRHMSLTSQTVQYARPRWRQRPVPTPSVVTTN